MQPTNNIPKESNRTRWFQIATALFFALLVATLGAVIWNSNPVTAQEPDKAIQQTDQGSDLAPASDAQPANGAASIETDSVSPDVFPKLLDANGNRIVDSAMIADPSISADPLLNAIDPAPNTVPVQPAIEENQVESITFGGGCFWCIEAVFQELDGVLSVESGYTNGLTENPTYREVCLGETGYAEVIRINYDPAKVEFTTLLEVFFKTHDPTTLNRQGGDTGTQYRSGVFYHSDAQREVAELIKTRLNESGAYRSPIVTEITAIENYYPAEDYHQNYFRTNGGPDGPLSTRRYCQGVIQPKLEKFREAFADKLKRDAPPESGN